MTQEHQRELLSSMMDNEIDELSVQRILRDTEKDPSILTQWADLHAGDAARRGLPVVDVLSGVNTALDSALDAAEREAQASEQQRRLLWQHERRGMVWGALAASLVVSVVAVFWVAPSTPSGSQEDSVVATTTLPAPVADDAIVVAQLQNYWAVHTQYSTYQAGARWDEVGSSNAGAL